ncbi:GntR family transcriptional regulator, partial [Streptomyces alkaliphilus]
MEAYRITGRRASEIVADIEHAVQSGVLPPDTALPPMRTLASRLGINPNTVAAAYRTLRERGVVETAGRRGTRVRRRPTGRENRGMPVPPGARDLASGNP